MKSVMQHTFSQVPQAEIQRSSFDRSHGYKTTFDAGLLVPIFFDDAIPGDTFKLNLTAFARLATPKLPIMDNMKMDFFFFSVPYRLVWDNFQRFMGEQPSPGMTTDFLIPQIRFAQSILAGDLADYFGLPTFTYGGVGDEMFVSALPFRAYNLIWNEWFRDQNLQDRIEFPKADGPDTATADLPVAVLRRGKRHDYFTSCLPWPQKGPAVELPLGSVAPVDYLPGFITNPYPRWVDNTGAVVSPGTGVSVQEGDGTGVRPHLSADLGGAYARGADMGFYAAYDPAGTLFADLSNATAATINSLREAFQLQRMFERDARGGTRYTEIIRAHFGTISPDARLQRPEYLGGGSVDVVFHPVANTAGTAGETGFNDQGALTAFATAQASGIGFNASFTEHCMIIGLASVRADLTYQQGIDRYWSKRTRFDFPWPALMHLGEQAVLNQEIFWEPNETAQNEGVFGYQERYAEYRYKQSKITGKFRSTDPQSLDAWHLSQEFANLPLLNEEFIQDNPPVDRVILVPSEPHFLYDSYIQLQCVRPMPVYSVPGLIDHL